MNGLELDVRQSGSHENGNRCRLVVEEALECAHAVCDVMVRWRHEVGVAGPRAADPVLRPAELTGIPLGPPPT